ncbi:MAG: putative membrane protein [Candidatus Methanohalarchaeum thermophilum]|uniref:Membrane protein n=1 Tax=Methanohalarchaeum thermophilum TaxID=1903181 RepID=A0A1Q6DWQ8_METT1|nr:MAG: putative membrane protein [Candidatus Methanohalarchaeum thermophilum]
MGNERVDIHWCHKPVLKSLIKNPGPMLKFGSGILALLFFYKYLVEGKTFKAVVSYFSTKHLPPTDIGSIIVPLLVVSVIAGLLWFLNVPK